MATLRIRQNDLHNGEYRISLTLKLPGRPDQEAEATIQFALTPQEQEDLRWYLEDYLQRADPAQAVTVQQVETLMRTRGEELYTKVLAFNGNTQALWFSIRNDLADLRVEIATGVAEAASIPWELMRDPEMDSPISLRVKSFVRVQSNPNISFVPVPSAEDGRVRLLYVVCRPRGAEDVELRAVANRLLQDLGENRALFDIKALRPPTFEQLQRELADAKEAGRPYHIVHFDGHGIYADLTETTLADWLSSLSSLTLQGETSGKHGYLLFEHPGSKEKMRPVDGQTLGQLLHDNGTPVVVLNACQSAMHDAVAAHKTVDSAHEEIRAIGSLAQAIVDQGIPAVLGMRYSVYAVTAAQYIGQLYSALAKGRNFGQAATEGRKHLQRNPERWLGLQPRPLQDWFVPVAYEAAPIELFPAKQATVPTAQPDLDPVQRNPALLRYVPDHGFIGRDETILALDRAFDSHRIVLLHAYAGQGKSTTAVEFARWYALTGGLGEQGIVLLAPFQTHTDLDDLMNQIGQPFAHLLGNPGVDWTALNDGPQRLAVVKRILRLVPILWIWDNVEPVAGFPEGTESQWTAKEQDALRDFLKQLQLDPASKVKILLTSRRDERGWLGAIPYRVPMPRMRNYDAAKLALRLGEEKHLSPSEIADWQPLLDYCSGNPLTLRVLVGEAVKMGLRGREPILIPPQKPSYHLVADSSGTRQPKLAAALGGVFTRESILNFVESIRHGEQRIADPDEKEGRDKSLAASLDYGFQHAFKDDELPIIALLHLFQGTVDVDVLEVMGRIGDYALPELKGKAKDHLAALLERARDIGLLTHLEAAWFTIHPALPWFLRQIFARCYDGQAGRSTSQAALRAWVVAVGEWGEYCMHSYAEGNQAVIGPLQLEEANLLHARRLARRHQWWASVTGSMQGLRVLYEYQGRTAEWARLVAEIVPDYCSSDDEPVSGRETDYSIVMQYRVDLALRHERDFAKASALQEKKVKWGRCRAAVALALPEDAPLDPDQRNRLRTLGVIMFDLGQIMREAGNAACLQAYQESIKISRRIRDKVAESVAEYNLGSSYKNLPEIRDLDAAEAAYQRSLGLVPPGDVLRRCRCIKQIGMVHHERFKDALKRKEPQETLLRHARAAERHYLQGLQLCPEDALADLAPMHNQLGSFYTGVGQFDKAREHLEQGAQYFEKVGNHFEAGATRRNIAAMYGVAAERESQPSQQRAYLLRARSYAEAALRDFQRYQGRAVADEAKVKSFLDMISQRIAKLPE